MKEAQGIQVRILWTCPICGWSEERWCKILGQMTKDFVDGRVDFELHVAPIPNGWQQFKDGRVVCENHVELP